MPDMPDTVTRSISVEFPTIETELPPCPAGWQPTPGIEWDGGELTIWLTRETGGASATFRKVSEQEIVDDFSEGETGYVERRCAELGLDDDAVDALSDYGRALMQRVDMDTYFVATAGLDSYRDLITERALWREGEQVDELADLVHIAEAAADGDSNDAEISALREALSEALRLLGRPDLDS